MTSIQEKVKEKSRQSLEDIILHRRHLHANPELSYQEYKTQAYIIDVLNDWGIENKKIAETGILATLKSKETDSKTIALRADIDALPILEKNEVPYKSKNSGVMHACGHDVHTSSMLGACKVLKELHDEWKGTIKILFQPGEEKLPGGATFMIKEGALKNPDAQLIFGQHVMPELKCGTVGFKPGMFMASADEIYVTIKGKGGHAAMPHYTVDPILTASHVITSLQSVISRNAPVNIPSVLSFGYIEGKGATNIIPDEVHLKGTFRTFDEEWRYQAHDRIKDIINSTAKAFGAEVDIDLKVGYPFLMNDESLTQRSFERSKDYMGEENVVELDLRSTAEDFAYYSHEIPACFYRLGISNENIKSNLHTSTFDIDEQALETGMGLMAFLAISELNS